MGEIGIRIRRGGGGTLGFFPPLKDPRVFVNFWEITLKFFFGKLLRICWSGRPSDLADYTSDRICKRLKKKHWKNAKNAIRLLTLGFLSEMAENYQKKFWWVFWVPFIGKNFLDCKKTKNDKIWWFLPEMDAKTLDFDNLQFNPHHVAEIGRNWPDINQKSF